MKPTVPSKQATGAKSRLAKIAPVQEHKPNGRPKGTTTQHKSLRVPENSHKVPRSSALKKGENWSRWAELDEDGMPIPPKGVGRPHGALDTANFINKLRAYSPDLIRAIVETGTFEGKTISAGTLITAKIFLEALEGYDPKERRESFRFLLERSDGWDWKQPNKDKDAIKDDKSDIEKAALLLAAAMTK